MSRTPSDSAGEARALLNRLRAAGVTLTAAVDLDGPADALADTDLAAARRLKPALLRLLVNPYRGVCTTNPHRQQVCDLLADTHDRDPLQAAELSRAWHHAIDDARAKGRPDPDAAAWDELNALQLAGTHPNNQLPMNHKRDPTAKLAIKQVAP